MYCLWGFSNNKTVCRKTILKEEKTSSFFVKNYQYIYYQSKKQFLFHNIFRVIEMKKYLVGFLLFIMLSPLSVMAYSDKVILGGENIGIHIETPGVMIIGFYKVNGETIKGNPSIQIGDIITKVNDTAVSKIDELTDAIEKEIQDNKVELTLTRNKEEIKVSMTLQKVDGIYKTGLYVKDGLTGLGTISYIDPSTKIYGALGHEILESSSEKIVEVKTGIIFESNVTSIRKSSVGNAGEKNADFNFNNVYGTIVDNTNHGIFGKYEKTLDTNTIDVAKPEEIKIGEATIFTVLNGKEKKEYTINITNIQEYNDIKNITFEITDSELINKTGGIVQGMSGSPIVQNNKLIGAVTHVIIDNPLTGYGIFITTMLESGDKIN